MMKRRVVSLVIIAGLAGCGTGNGAGAGRATPSPGPPVLTLPSPAGAAQPANASPPGRPECARSGDSVALTVPCRLHMTAGTALTATLRWPFRVTQVTGTSARLDRPSRTARGAEQFRITGVRPGETDITATFNDNAPGAPGGYLPVIVTVNAA